MTKPANKKPISSHRQQLYILGSILLATLVVFAGFKYFQYQNTLEVEAEGFKDLKQDMLALQTRLNESDGAWKYSETCSSKDRLGSSNSPRDCSMTVAKYLGASPDVETYINMIMSTKITDSFETTGSKLMKSSENIYYQKFYSKKFSNSVCRLDTYTPANARHNVYLSLICTHGAHKFYFNKE